MPGGRLAGVEHLERGCPSPRGQPGAPGVAMPQVRCTRLSAVRSAMSSEPQRPLHPGHQAAPDPRSAPSFASKLTFTRGSKRWKTRAKAASPERTIGSLAHSSARPRAAAGTSARVVTSPGRAEVLVERQIDQPIDEVGPRARRQLAACPRAFFDRLLRGLLRRGRLLRLLRGLLGRLLRRLALATRPSSPSLRLAATAFFPAGLLFAALPSSRRFAFRLVLRRALRAR